MKFKAVLSLLANGEKVARKSWNKNTWIQAEPRQAKFKFKPNLKLVYIYKNSVPWISSSLDILAEDWVLVDENKENHFKCSVNELLWGLRRSFIASFVQPGEILYGEKSNHIYSEFERIMKKIKS